MKKMTRREFIKTPPKILAAAALGSAAGAIPAQSDSPNVLLIMVDQMQTPPEGYGADEGAAQGMKEIFGFRSLSPDNEFTRFFPGLLRLRQNAVVMRRHHTAAAACVPSRTSILTGQYPSVTGVDQTDGLFKSAHDIPWLDPNGIPTIGDWFRAAGYSTHYFGKWHVSEVTEEVKSLEQWGFSDWETSYPDAHGGPADNAGAFRDVEVADNVEEFIKTRGKDVSKGPWFAVGSLLNPHDCSIWPINWQAPKDRGVVPWATYPPPPTIPAMGDKSRLGGVKSPHVVELNPDGFPQNNSSLPPTYTESLDDKPHCQKDYAYKWGFAFGANIDYSFAQSGSQIKTPQPFQLQGENAAAWSQSYNQFYFYCHYLADLQLRRILQALDDNSLSDNTIVVFLSDHGELAGAHGGMIQKWHNAYEETIRVPMVVSSPLVNKNKREMREIQQPTSSIDFAPTILSLAGFDIEQVRGVMETIHGKAVLKPFAGADLSSLIKGAGDGDIIGPDGKPRTGVLFMSNDSITDLCANPTGVTPDKYSLFQNYVKTAIDAGIPLAPDSVRQPNHVRALCTGDWKIVRYLDPNGVETDEWELYCLKTDPIEQTNLVDFRTGEVRNDVSLPGLTIDEVRSKNMQLRMELAKQEAVTTLVYETPGAPEPFQLLQNYPNPFNPITTIPYTVPHSVQVKLEIINMLGQRVKTLINARIAAGTHTMEWDATDEHGAPAPSGVYFCRLLMEGFQKTRTLTLLR
jgi:arylsulfatase A-like enzyme